LGADLAGAEVVFFTGAAVAFFTGDRAVFAVLPESVRVGAGRDFLTPSDEVGREAVVGVDVFATLMVDAALEISC